VSTIGSERGLGKLFEPRSIAVIGASADPAKAGNAMLRALRSFPGRLFPINPRHGSVLDLEAFESVSSTQHEIDLAVLCVPPGALLDAVGDCAAAGVAGAVICTGGLAESGPDGAVIEAEISAIAESTGLRVLGPNTSGFLNPAAGVYASFVLGAQDVRPGRVGVVAQSGGVNHHVAFSLAAHGVGVSIAAGLGNGIDIGATELLEYLAADDETSVILLALEGVEDGRRLCDRIARVIERKPVVVLKVGTGEQQAFAQSHTGAIAGDDVVARAALSQAGAVLVSSSDELVDAGRALLATRLGARSSVGVGLVSGQAGPALLLADSLAGRGLRLPELARSTQQRLATLLPPITYQQNPVDTGRPGEMFREVVETVANDDAVDLLVVYALDEPDALDPVTEIPPAVSTTGIPLVFVTSGPLDEVAETAQALAAQGIATFLSQERAVGAVAALASDAQARARLAAGGRRLAPAGAAMEQPATVSEATAKDLLEAIGVPTPKREVHLERSTIPGVLGRLRAPLVVKILDPEIIHKAEVGGVRTDVETEATLERALDAIDSIRGARDGPYLIEEQVEAGPELIVGGTRDPSFGPVIALGLGGFAAEALANAAFRCAPITVEDAHEMVESLRGARLLDGFRGMPVVDRDELVAVLVGLADLLSANNWIREFDVNPLRATSDGLIALDALIVCETQGTDG
jgi:acetate---CoA ligase (ADP-forming)